MWACTAVANRTSTPSTFCVTLHVPLARSRRLMPPPTSTAAKVWRRFGYTALTTGLVIIVLIVYSVLFAYR